MGLFKNKVGRPSNKTIRTRRIIYSLLAITVIGLLFAASYMLNSAFNLNKIKGATKSKKINTPTIEIASVDSKLKIGEESFEAGNYIKTDNIGEDLVSINKNKKIKVRGRFPKLFYSGFWKNKFIFRAMAYGQNDTLIGQVQSSKITKETFEYEFTITDDVKYIKADVVIGIEGYIGYPFIESVTNFITKSDATKVNIEYRSNVGLEANGDEIIKVNEYGSYISHAIINNENNDILYYRWFTYDNIDPSKSKLTYRSIEREEKDFCVPHNDSHILVKRLGLSVNNNYKKRSGILKVYTTKDACEKDNTSKTEALAEGIIKYVYDNNVKSNKNKISIAAKKNTIVSNGKSYNKGEFVSFDNIGSNIIFASENDIITIKSNFTNKFYSNKNYYIKYIVYGSKKEILNESESILIDNEQSNLYNVNVNSNVRSVEVKISYGKLGENDINLIYNDVVKIAVKPTVTFTDNSKDNNKELKLIKNSSGNYIVSKFQNYSAIAKISNPSGAPIYYRWFTYSHVGTNKKDVSYGSKIGQGDTCTEYRNKIITTGSLGLKVAESIPDRSGKIKIYSNKEDCKNDRSSVDTQSIGFGTINYIYNASSSNSNNVVVELKDKNNKPGKDGIYQAKENTDYFPTATVTNNTNSTIYYRWFTYKKLNAKEYRYDDEVCYSINKESANITSLERIEVSDYDRSGKLKIYNNYNNCINDTKGVGNNYLSQAIINYKYNKKSTSSGSVKVDYTDENLYVLSHIISAEAGGESDECQLAVGSVVLNRVKSKHFPDTIYDVVFEPGQYSPTWEGTYYNTPTQRAINNAKNLLENGSQLPNNVLFQAGFAQGSGVYKIIDGEYFCYY